MARDELKMVSRPSRHPQLFGSLLVPGFGGMDRFVCKEPRPCQTLSWDRRGRAERPSARRQELWCGSRGMADSEFLRDEIRDCITEQAIHRNCDSAVGRQRQTEYRRSGQQVLSRKPSRLEGDDN